jgi:O-antigen/teichoic acid export membrane protein
MTAHLAQRALYALTWQCAAVLSLILALHLMQPPLYPFRAVQEYHHLFRVATAEVLNNVTNYFNENLDFFVLGKWLGASALGLYNR